MSPATHAVRSELQNARAGWLAVLAFGPLLVLVLTLISRALAAS